MFRGYLKIKIFLFLLFAASLAGEIVETFYGPVEVQEPILLELIECPAMQRLKKLHQYGISYYTTHSEPYNRFDHSVGVFAILRKSGASLLEQIAGLLHDASHTAFSHVGDYLFHAKDAYQDEIHEWFLERSGIGEILQKHGYKIEDVLPKSGRFHALEQELPNLSADRIDYNLQGAYFQGFLSKEEAVELFADFQFIEDNWVSTKADLLEKMASFSLFMTQDCWGSAVNYFISHWFSEAIRRAIEIGLIQIDEIHFGTDDDLWERIFGSKDPIIEKLVGQIFHPLAYFSIGEPAEIRLPMKFRGVDPWVLGEKGVIRLTALRPNYGSQFLSVQSRMKEGWPVYMINERGMSSTR